MKRFIAILLAVAMVLSLSACQFLPKLEDPDTTPAATMQPEDAANAVDKILEGKTFENVYKTYFSSSYASFNYYSTAYATVREIIANCIDGLVEPNTYGVYVPSLAESWKSNEDQTVWTFKIREGLKWIDHTGKETEYAVTAQDFVDGIRYIGDPLNGAYSLRVVRNLIEGLYDYYWLLDDIDSGTVTDTTREDAVATFDEVVGVKAIDEYTVEYTLTSSAPYFLSLIESSMLMLPVEYEYAMSLGEDFAIDNEHMLYCGAYYVSAFERDKAITLTANPNYWDKENVTIETVEYQMIPDGTTSLEMFKRGETDYTSVEAEAYLSLQGTEWADNLLPTSHSFSTNYLWLDFAGENPEFNKFINNENFRKALMYSLNRESLASLREPVDPKRILRNTINAEGAIYDSNGVDYTDYSPLKEIKETDYNQPELAKQYMEAAIKELCDENGNIIGCEPTTVDYLPVCSFDVDGKLPVTICYVGTDDEAEIIMAQLFKAMIEESIGADYIDFQIQAYSGWTYGTVADPLNYDIYFDSLSTGYADPSGILTRMTTDGAENVGKYNVPEFDALIEKALAATTFEERLQYFAEAEAYLCGNGFVIPFISSLRGYYMSYSVPYTSPLTLYGNTKYKGTLVMSEPLTKAEFDVFEAAYDVERAEALKAN
ncbi:MAG: peptide ABC transporter substrate-binding protein [Clostridia bacterium]|nr:peptide ABC transporter substrate-binding protein [Clostridia bacterium]